MIRNAIVILGVLSALVVALIFGTITASAEDPSVTAATAAAPPIAPVIEPLPSVVIGDAGDVSGYGMTALHLFRYTNIMNLATSSKITWGNADRGFTDAQKHAYYMSTPPGAIQASTDQRMVPELTISDLAQLQTNGSSSSSAIEITDRAGDGGPSDFFYLSLANNMSSTAGVNAYNATPLRNGKEWVQYGTNFQLSPAVVTLILADGDYPTTAIAQTDFSVYTIPGADDGFSGIATKIYEQGSEFNWVYTSAQGEYFSDAIHNVSGGALTMSRGADPSKIYFGSWNSGKIGSSVPQTVIPANQSLMEDNIYRATFTLNSTAVNAQDTPGYRLFYESEAFTHFGGISHNSTERLVGTSIYAPSEGSPKDVILYWAVPFALSQYDDTGKLATHQSGKDYRDYFLAFDMVGYEASDTGIIGLSNVLVEIIARPEGHNLVSWGEGGTAFNSPMSISGWTYMNLNITGIGLGKCTINQNDIKISAISNSELSGYQQTGLYANATILPSWQSNKLIRTNVQLKSSAINFSPNFRILTLSCQPIGNSLSMIWFDCFSGDTAKRLWGPAMVGAAGSPVTDAGSLIETYLWTHTASSGEYSGALVPQFDCWAIGEIEGSNAQGSWLWPVENATFTISKFQYEECAQY